MKRCTYADAKMLQGIIETMTPDMLRAHLAHLLVLFLGRTRITFEMFSRSIDATRIGIHLRDQMLSGEATPTPDEQKPS